MKTGFVVVMIAVVMATAVDSLPTCAQLLLAFTTKCRVSDPPIGCLADLGALYIERCVPGKKLETDVNDLKAQVTALRAKVDTLYQPVAFSAHLIKDDQKGFLHGPGKVMYYDDVTYNAGGAYNKATGKFTAPRAGTYVFVATIMGIDTVMLEIKKNGNDLHAVYAKEYADTGSNTVTTHLAAGDKVWVELHGYYASHKYRGSTFTSLSGFLVTPDKV